MKMGRLFSLYKIYCKRFHSKCNSFSRIHVSGVINFDRKWRTEFLEYRTETNSNKETFPITQAISGKKTCLSF